MNTLLFKTGEYCPELPDVLKQGGFGNYLAEDEEDFFSVLSLDYPYDAIVYCATDRNDSLLTKVRNCKNPLPFLVVTPEQGIRIDLLNHGADVVLELPVDKRELLAYLSVLIRRHTNTLSCTKKVGEVEVDFIGKTAKVCGQHIHFTNSEYVVIELLVSGRMTSKSQIHERMYGARTDDWPDIKIVDVMVSKIRKKIRAFGGGDPIVTHWGRGYVLEDKHEN